MNRNERPSIATAIFIMLAALQTLTVFLPGALSGQTIQQKQENDSVQPDVVTVYSLGAGRLGGAVGAVLGLVGVVVGGMALRRPAGRFGTTTGRLGVNVALVLGLIGMALGGLVLATAGGGIGTGNGLGGAVVALVLGLIGVVIGGVGVARSRSAGSS